jgi:hypothetical protein
VGVELRGLITFLGWITLVRAGLRLVAPTAATTGTRTGRHRPRLVAAYTGLAFLMGVYLLLVGLGINVPR